MPHRRGADSLLSAEPRGRKKNRREGLGQGVADVLAISSGIKAIHAPSSLRSRLRSISAGTKPSVVEIVSPIDFSSAFDGTVTRAVTPGTNSSFCDQSCVVRVTTLARAPL